MPDSIPSQRADRTQLQQIIAGLTEGIIFVGSDKSIEWVNDTALALHGVRNASDLGATVTEYRRLFELRYLDGEKLAAAEYPMDRLLADDVFGELVVEVCRKGETKIRVHRIRALILKEPDGQPDCRVLIIMDDTDRFNAEQRFERAFGANPAPAIIVRLADMRYVKVNQGFLEMTGYRRETLIGRSMHELDILKGMHKRELAVQRLHAGDTIPQMEGHLELPGEREKLVLLGGQPIEIGDSPCMLFTFADLDQRHQAQLALRQSEERFSKAFHMAPGPMAILALDGLRILDVNSAFTDATGWRREEVVGRGQSELEVWGQGETRERLERQLKHTGHLHSVDVLLRARGGGVGDFLMSAETVEIGGERCVLSVMLNITERKQSETALMSAIESVMQDTSWFGQKIVEKLAVLSRQHGRAPSAAPDSATLPERAREVLGLIAQGLSDDQIAAKLRISKNTVRNHVSGIYARLGIRKRSALIVWARERGFAAPAKPRAQKKKSARRAKA